MDTTPRTYCRYIHVKHQFEDFHKYEDAPEEVAFLRNLHRHVFHITATIEVEHNERELEFFMVKKVLERDIVPYIRMVAGGLGSCETMAENILEGLINVYGDKRLYSINVAEDDENSATVTYAPY